MFQLKRRLHWSLAQLTFTCLNSKTEALEKGAKYVQSLFNVWNVFNVFVVNFENFTPFLVFLLLTLNK